MQILGLLGSFSFRKKTFLYEASRDVQAFACEWHIYRNTVDFVTQINMLRPIPRCLVNSVGYDHPTTITTHTPSCRGSDLHSASWVLRVSTSREKLQYMAHQNTHPSRVSYEVSRCNVFIRTPEGRQGNGQACTIALDISVFPVTI